MSTEKEKKALKECLDEIKLRSKNIDQFTKEGKWVLAKANVDYLRTALDRWEAVVPKDANWSY